MIPPCFQIREDKRQHERDGLRIAYMLRPRFGGFLTRTVHTATSPRESSTRNLCKKKYLLAIYVKEISLLSRFDGFMHST